MNWQAGLSFKFCISYQCDGIIIIIISSYNGPSGTDAAQPAIQSTGINWKSKKKNKIK